MRASWRSPNTSEAAGERDPAWLDTLASPAAARPPSVEKDAAAAGLARLVHDLQPQRREAEARLHGVGAVRSPHRTAAPLSPAEKAARRLQRRLSSRDPVNPEVLTGATAALRQQLDGSSAAPRTAPGGAETHAGPRAAPPGAAAPQRAAAAPPYSAQQAAPLRREALLAEATRPEGGRAVRCPGHLTGYCRDKPEPGCAGDLAAQRLDGALNAYAVPSSQHAIATPRRAPRTRCGGAETTLAMRADVHAVTRASHQFINDVDALAQLRCSCERAPHCQCEEWVRRHAEHAARTCTALVAPACGQTDAAR